MKRVDLEKAYWNKNALDPEVDEKYIADVPTELCLQDIGELKGEVLEIGCGVGRLLREGYVGVDTSVEMLNIARQRTNNRVVHNDGRTLPFDDESFDSVYSYLVFQHLPFSAFGGYKDEAYRVLRKGGLFVFQFIEGDETEMYSNHYPREVVEQIMPEFKDIKFYKSVAYDGWTICKATK